MLLWILLACLTAAVVTALVYPLQKEPPADSPDASHIELYKAQLRELEADRTAGLISETDAAAASLEISRRLLKAADESAAAAGHRGRLAVSYRLLPILIAVGVTGGSLTLYLLSGSPNLPAQPLTARLNAPDNSQNLEALVAKVEARLREHPEDGRGWSVIAPVYMRMMRYDDAREAYVKAISLLGETPERLAGYAEAATLANNGLVPDYAKAAFKKAVEQRPDLINARFWLAVAAEDSGDLAGARQSYQDMLRMPLRDDWRGAIQAKLAALEAKEKGELTPSVSPEQAAQQAMIEGMVARLAERLEQQGGDVREWLKLARAYSVLGKNQDAAATLSKARERFAGNAEALKQIDALAASLGIKS